MMLASVLGLAGFLLSLVVLGVLVVAAGAILFGITLARRSKVEYDAGNQTVPGRSARVPDSWGGSHDPEAVLHRRLVTAMAALRANQAFDDDGGMLDLRVELEQQALALDERLVATAALPARLQAEPRAQAEEAVARVEQAVADLVGCTAADALPALQAALDDVRQRTELMGDARASLEPGAPTAAETVAPTPISTPAPAPAPVPVSEPAPAEPPPPVQTSPPQPSPPQTSPPQTSPPQTSPPTPPADGTSF